MNHNKSKKNNTLLKIVFSTNAGSRKGWVLVRSEKRDGILPRFRELFFNNNRWDFDGNHKEIKDFKREKDMNRHSN